MGSFTKKNILGFAIKADGDNDGDDGLGGDVRERESWKREK